MTAILWEEHRIALLSQAYRLVRNMTDAQDLVQDTFLRAYVRKDQQRDLSTTLPWLRSILFTVFCNQFIKQKRRGDTSLYLNQMSENSEIWQSQKLLDSPERMVMNEELGAALQKAISDLPPQYQECLILCDSEGLRYNTIAEQLNLSLPVVKSRLHRARRRVRASLIEQGYGI